MDDKISFEDFKRNREKIELEKKQAQREEFLRKVAKIRETKIRREEREKAQAKIKALKENKPKPKKEENLYPLGNKFRILEAERQRKEDLKNQRREAFNKFKEKLKTLAPQRTGKTKKPRYLQSKASKKNLSKVLSGAFAPRTLRSRGMTPLQQAKHRERMVKLKLKELELRKKALSTPMSDDPRYKFDSTDAWLERDEFPRQNQQIPQSFQRRGFSIPKISIRDFFQRFGRQPQSQQEFYDFQRQQQGLMGWGGMREDPRQNILNAQNIFNRPQEQTQNFNLLRNLLGEQNSVFKETKELQPRILRENPSDSILNAERLKW